MKNLSNLSDLFAYQLKEMHEAEKYQKTAFPKLIESVHNAGLKKILLTKSENTKVNMSRIEEAFDIIGKKAGDITCKTVEDLMKRAITNLNKSSVENVREASLILSVQCVNHFMIANYGTLVAFADALGYKQIADSIREIVKDEKNIDTQLTKLAMETVNSGAMVEEVA